MGFRLVSRALLILVMAALPLSATLPACAGTDGAGDAFVDLEDAGDDASEGPGSDGEAGDEPAATGEDTVGDTGAGQESASPSPATTAPAPDPGGGGDGALGDPPRKKGKPSAEFKKRLKAIYGVVAPGLVNDLWAEFKKVGVEAVDGKPLSFNMRLANAVTNFIATRKNGLGLVAKSVLGKKLPAGSTGVVKRTGIGLRSTPGGSWLRSVPKGAQLTLTGRADGGWIQVENEPQSGWISIVWLRFGGKGTPLAPTTSTSQSAPESAPASTGASPVTSPPASPASPAPGGP